ncbi:ureidoglycolate hydrolase [Escherichia coli]|uniref:Ureidoglycolate hydrolase n=1 Tax=Escherichia coli TaxID=562 RepID=A0A377KB99_ECOLX|nr:ureidoglycolate hydrolase [Escherichia coli]
MKLQVLPLSQEAFCAYGDVIETPETGFFPY